MNRASLEHLARAEVEGLLRCLPSAMAVYARAVPVVLLPRPTRAMIREDGVEPDLLGLFVGPSRLETDDAHDPLPAEILLFIENLWAYAEGDVAMYREEVRVTYYHELGHYLGLEEDDLEARGIE